MEVAEAALERARAVAPGAELRLLDEDGSIPLEHGGVDLVWCSEVLEHVADIAGLLPRSAACCARAGGCSPPCPTTARLRGRDRADPLRAHFDPLGQHLRFFTRRSLARGARATRASSPVRVAGWGGVPLARRGLVALATR